jgi:ABC-2 type transport system ATP-binding protein
MASDALVTTGLTYRFGRRVAVRELSIRVATGDVYGFLGPNGAGKTTFIRCVLDLLRPESGTVEIFGETDPVARRAAVGAVVETPAFHLNMTGRANLNVAAAYARVSDSAEIDRVIDRVGLSARGDDRVGTYSLGMRQRLGLARALLGRPQLLLLDEPTNGLDPRGMKEVRDLLRDLARRDGITVFLSSHLLGEVEQLCNRVAIIEHGELVSEGPVGALESSASRALQVDVGADPEALGQAMATLEGVSVVGDGEAGRIRLSLDGIDISQLNRALVAAGVDVAALVPVEARLEDDYMALTSESIQ